MSRRASVFARQNPGKRRVRFPDEVVFEESIKESDGMAIMALLRRASVDIDVNRINMAGMTALHQAVLDNNLVVVHLLLKHGAQIDQKDEDSWTALHAAAANGHHRIAEVLLAEGASRDALTDEGETATDLADPEDFKMLAVLRNTQVSHEQERRLSLGPEAPREPPWLRRESLAAGRGSLLGLLQPSRPREESLLRDTFSLLRARKGSMYPRGDEGEVVEEEEFSSSDSSQSSISSSTSLSSPSSKSFQSGASTSSSMMSSPSKSLSSVSSSGSPSLTFSSTPSSSPSSAQSPRQSSPAESSVTPKWVPTTSVTNKKNEVLNLRSSGCPLPSRVFPLGSANPKSPVLTSPTTQPLEQQAAAVKRHEGSSKKTSFSQTGSPKISSAPSLTSTKTSQKQPESLCNTKRTTLPNPPSEDTDKVKNLHFSSPCWSRESSSSLKDCKSSGKTSPDKKSGRASSQGQSGPMAAGCRSLSGRESNTRTPLTSSSPTPTSARRTPPHTSKTVMSSPWSSPAVSTTSSVCSTGTRRLPPSSSTLRTSSPSPVRSRHPCPAPGSPSARPKSSSRPSPPPASRTTAAPSPASQSSPQTSKTHPSPVTSFALGTWLSQESQGPGASEGISKRDQSGSPSREEGLQRSSRFETTSRWPPTTTSFTARSCPTTVDRSATIGGSSSVARNGGSGGSASSGPSPTMARRNLTIGRTSSSPSQPEARSPLNVVRTSSAACPSKRESGEDDYDVGAALARWRLRREERQER